MGLLDIAGEGLFLLLARNARVDENRIAGIVAQDKAVHAEGIHDKLLDNHVRQYRNVLFF